MRVGQSPSSHNAGMSALWHDADWVPDKSLHVPTVVQKFPDEGDALPSEQHQLPKGVDAFAKMDEMYAVAGDQMDRGIDAQAFLYGSKRAVGAPEQSASISLPDGGMRQVDPAEQTSTMVQRSSDPDRKIDVRAAQDNRAVDDEIRKATAAGNQPIKVSNATETANNSQQEAARAVKTLEMAEGIGVTMAAIAAGQAIDPASSTIAAEAASVIKAVSTAKTAVGMTKPMDDLQDLSRADALRRGLRARRDDQGQPADRVNPIGHQPSLDPGDDKG